jgi:hypothetical protein
MSPAKTAPTGNLAGVCRLTKGGRVLTFEYLPPLDPNLVYDEPPNPWSPFERIWGALIESLVDAGLAAWTEEIGMHVGRSSLLRP